MVAKVFSMPNKVLYGPNAMEQLPKHFSQLGAKKPLIVTDRLIVSMGFPGKLQDLLQAEGLDSVIYDGVNSEPEDNYVYEGLDILRQHNCDSVIGLGGGSPLDAAKAIAIMAKNKGKISDYEGRGIVIPGGRLPLAGISTTAGTSSEVSNTTIITDTTRGTKMVIKTDIVRPDIAVCDPVLTLGLPPKVTAASGLDALAHAMEGMVSRSNQPLGNIMAKNAINLIYNNLPIAYDHGDNLDARSNMMMGQMLAGLTMANASTASIHGMARPVGAKFHIGHGLCVAMFMPEVMEFTLPGSPEVYQEIAEAMGLDVIGLSAEEAGRKAVEAVYALRKYLGVSTLREYGVDREEFIAAIPKMLEDKSANNTHKLNAVVPTDADKTAIYMRVIDE